MFHNHVQCQDDLSSHSVVVEYCTTLTLTNNQQVPIREPSPFMGKQISNAKKTLSIFNKLVSIKRTGSPSRRYMNNVVSCVKVSFRDICNFSSTWHIQFNLDHVNRCGYEQHGSEYEFGPYSPDKVSTDGMAGFGKRASSLPTQLQSQGKIRRNIVGHCLLPMQRRANLQRAGFLFVGDSKILKNAPMTWTPMNLRAGADLL